MADDESFADYPPSVAELRSDKANDGRLWAPRDALISLLRDIDSGKIAPQSILIIHKTRNGQREDYMLGRTRAGCRDRHEIAGILAEALHLTVKDDLQ